MSNKTVQLDALIAKIDNDFNPDNSDWIPRVGVWAIEAMMQIKVLRTVDKERKLEVHDRFAQSPCEFDKNDIKVYDENHCEIQSADDVNKSCCSSNPSFTGNMNSDNCHVNPRGTLERDYDPSRQNIKSIAFHVNTPNERARYNVVDINISDVNNGKNYVLANSNTIELNFDADYIYVVSKEVETCYSDTYGCELPVIPNNAVLLEAIGYYCMYKMLTRGYKHPVMNLAASQYGTNPYYLWTTLKEKAKTSVTLDEQVDNNKDSQAWQSYFYNATFPTK